MYCRLNLVLSRETNKIEIWSIRSMMNIYPFLYHLLSRSCPANRALPTRLQMSFYMTPYGFKSDTGSVRWFYFSPYTGFIERGIYTHAGIWTQDLCEARQWYLGTVNTFTFTKSAKFPKYWYFRTPILYQRWF